MLHVTARGRKLHVTCNSPFGSLMSASDVNSRVKKYRDSLRKAGLRPIQLWVPDTRLPGFAEECHRQSLLAAAADAADKDLLEFMDKVLDDISDDDWKA